MNSARSPVVNALTIDVEDWYHGNGLNVPPSEWDHLECRVVPATRRLLAILERHGVKATFFVLGDVAQRHPRLVREIAAAGHEIGSHGMTHRLLRDESMETYTAALRRSKALLESLSGQEVIGHRAASWSITPETAWALTVVESTGFRYDSSLYPVRTPLYGSPRTPARIHRVAIPGGRALLEFPPPVARVGCLRVPFSGGFFLRVLPVQLVARWLGALNERGQPALVYVHPWEIDPEQPRRRAPALRSFVHRHGLAHTETKLLRLLERFRFAPARDVLRAGGWL